VSYFSYAFLSFIPADKNTLKRGQGSDLQAQRESGPQGSEVLLDPWGETKLA